MAHRMAVLAAMALLVMPATASPADPPQLNAKFNANLTFSMSTQDGSPLGSPSPPGRTIPAGYYAVNVDDTAEIGYMTFLLQGPGVALRTTNDEGASASLTYYVTLQPGVDLLLRRRGQPEPAARVLLDLGDGRLDAGGKHVVRHRHPVERSDAVEHGEPGRQLRRPRRRPRRAHPPPPRSSGATSRRRSARRAT